MTISTGTLAAFAFKPVEKVMPSGASDCAAPADMGATNQPIATLIELADTALLYQGLCRGSIRFVARSRNHSTTVRVGAEENIFARHSHQMEPVRGG